MAFSTIYPHKKIFESPAKRSDAALKRYSSADPRLWKDDKFQRSIGLQDVLTRDTHRNQPAAAVDAEHLNRAELLNEIDKLLQEIKLKDHELGKIHALYMAASRKLKDLEGASRERKKYQDLLRESEEELRRVSDLHSQNDDKETIRVLRERLEKYSNVDSLLERLKERSEEADRMEEEIGKLRRDLLEAAHGASGDKIKIHHTASGTTDYCSNSDAQCHQCQMYRHELAESKSMFECEEKKNVEIEAERNFLRSRIRTIEVMEAELILYKTKYEECNCTLLRLKELLIKADKMERELNASREELNTTKGKLQASEQKNQELISMIEHLDMDLSERDIYIESISHHHHRLSKETEAVCASESLSRSAIALGDEINGQGQVVQSIAEKLSNQIDGEENMIEIITLSSRSSGSTFEPKSHDVCEKKKSLRCDETLTISEFNRLRQEVSCDKIKHLQLENEEFDREMRRLRERLAEMSTVVSELEIHRVSNCQLEREMSDLRCVHSRELETINANYRATMCQKISQLQAIEGHLNAETERANRLEQRLACFHEELKALKDFRKSCEKIDECHCARLKELDNFQNECIRKHDENQILKDQIKSLTGKIEDIKSSAEQKARNTKAQRDSIKRSIVEFKEHYEQKAFMIKCYEDKIMLLEAENDALKCFRDKFLRGNKCDCCNCCVKTPQIVEALSREEEGRVKLHDRVVKDGTISTSVDYSKMIDQLCAKYQIKSTNTNTA